MRKKNLFPSFLLGLCLMAPVFAVAQYDMNHPVSYRVSDTGRYLRNVYSPYQQMTPRAALYYYASQANQGRIYQITMNGYSIDTPDAQGNTALCEAILRSDEVAVKTLIEMGAHQNSMCMQCIPAVLKNVVGLDPENVKMVDVHATPEISISNKVSGSLGALAVLGGGIALGISGGSSGGNDTPVTECNGHGTKNKNKLCVCDKGYDGESCETCATDYTKIGQTCYPEITCAHGGTQTGESTCSCVENWDPSTKCTTCLSGTIQSGEKCVTECAANEYFNGTACVKCQHGGESDGGVVQACSCDTSQNWTGPGCDQCGLSGPHDKNTCQCSADTFQFGMRCVSTAKGAAPEDFDRTQFKTTEFTKGNFLSQIKADAAYARGYTGYIVNRDQNGVLQNVNDSLISDEKIKVGVMDNYLDVTHPDLQNNLYKEGGKAVGFNFDYGPCRNGDKTNCYAMEGNLLVFYNKTVKETLGRFSQTEFDKYASKYSDNYDWDSGDTKYQVGSSANTKTDSFIYTNAVEEDHGTHVSGIISATKNDTEMHGILPDSTLVFTQAILSGDLTSRWFLSGMEKYVELGVKAVNMSWGREEETASDAINKNADDVFSSYEVEGMKLAQKNGIVVVRAAGNNSEKYHDAILDAGLPLTNTFKPGSEFDLSNLYISVVSVDKNNKLASYSQPCGSTKGFCLAAPGGDINRGGIKNMEEWGIYSTVKNDAEHKGGYGYMQGTSMAAPVVTGSVALLMSAYPHLTSQQVVQILFQTSDYLEPVSAGAVVATDAKGHKYNSDTGYGLINLDAATQPVDGLHFNITSLTPTSNLSGNMETSQLVLPKPIVVKLMGSLPETFTAFDGFDRPFAIDTTSLFKTDYTQRTHTFETDFKAFMNSDKMSHIGEKDSALSFDFKSQTSSMPSSVPYGFFGMNVQPTKSMKFSSYYTENTLYGRGHYFKRYLENPFVNMKKAYGMDFSYDMNDKTKMSLVFTNGRNAFYQDEEDDDVYNNQMTSFMASLSHKVVSPLTLTVSAGSLREKDSFLGMIGRDSFNFDKTKTNFVGGKIKYAPTDNLSFEASYYRGYSDGIVNTDILGMSGVESESMAFNATYKLNESQQMGLDIYSPLRIVKGQASMTLATGRHETQDITYYNTYSADLKPKGREVVFSMFYDDELSKLLDYNLRLGVRLEPDHQENARPDYFGLFKLNYNY